MYRARHMVHNDVSLQFELYYMRAEAELHWQMYSQHERRHHHSARGCSRALLRAHRSDCQGRAGQLPTTGGPACVRRDCSRAHASGR